MKARLFSLLIVLMCLLVTVHAQSYEKLWKEVKEMKKMDRPKSALELTQTIYRKAKQERNVPEMMKAYMCGMDFRGSITPDSIVRDIDGLERWVSETNEPVDAAVLHSLLGEMYANYFSLQSVISLRGTAIADISGDMTEWSGNLFIQKIFEHLRLSLKDTEVLARTNTDVFKPIVKKGETSDYFRHDMFHLLGQRAVAVLSPLIWKANTFYPQSQLQLSTAYPFTTTFLKDPIPEASDYDCLAEMLRIYQSMLQYYTKLENIRASALVNLDRLTMVYENVNLNSKTGRQKVDSLMEFPYFKALMSLSDQYASVDVCAEVYKKMADFMLASGYPSEALAISREALRKYPSYGRINMFRELEAGILQPRLNGQTDENAYPGKVFDLRINYCNLSGLTVKMYKVNLPVTSELLNNSGEKSFRSKYAKFTKSEHFKLALTSNYLSVDTVLKVVAPEEGIWLLDLVPDAKVKVVQNDSELLYVSKLKVIYRSLPSDEAQFVVVDSESGHPVSQADVLIYRKEGDTMKQLKTLSTDRIGTATAHGIGEFDAFRAQKGADVGMNFVNTTYWPYRGSGKSYTAGDLSLFTDRSIYRPGQTVYVAGIAYEVSGDSARVFAGKEYTLSLYDANRKMISEKKVKTNDFGSFAGEFQLPSPCLTGRFSLRAGYAQTSFVVDEYKRPTFDVTFLPIKEVYRTGDSIWVTGIARTYSGVPIQNGDVKYSVKTGFPYWMMRDNGSAITSGTAKTNDKGEFSVHVYLDSLAVAGRTPYLYYNYIVNAAVTDGAGETQNGTLNIPSGKHSLILSCSIPEKIQKESKDSLIIHVRNLNGEPETVGGFLEVYKLTLPATGIGSILGERVLRESFIPNKAFEPVSIINLPSGMYRLILVVKDSQGRESRQESDFVLYSLEDKKPPYPTTCWFQPVRNEFGPDSPATVLFGSSDKDVYVMYDVFGGGKHLESKRILLTDSVVKMVYPYKAEYGDGLFVQFTFVKAGKLYEESTSIIKTAPDKKLSLKWETFRDKLRPGQQEEWKLRILSPDGKPAEAELLATLYDASLDKLEKHDWRFNLNFPRSVERVQWYGGYPGMSFLNVDFFVKQWKYKPLVYDRFTVGSLNDPSDYCEVVISPRSTGSSANRPFLSRVGAKMAGSTPVMESAAVADASKEEQSPVPSSPLDVPVRENFAETAFFYPQLRTNPEGEVSLSFTLPESLTQWKFLGLSHTRKMDWGKIEAVATASKDFMISPNMPRFVRIGDAVSIAANIINLTGKEISGTAVMELFAPETERVFVARQQNFRVKAGETETVTFSFIVDENYPSLLACRMIAKSTNFSDGEQRLLPVLSNKQEITESVPMTVNGKETREFTLSRLFNHDSKTATDRRLTVEFAGNPAWYAVQALPSLSNPTNENAISWVSAYYANSVASYIAHANPRIKAVFDSWKQQGGTKESLLSNLQKNQELKNILLQETPWVMEATNEADQKQRIATLFDLNTIQYNNAIAIDKLKTLQQNGAWSWYRGMAPSPYITLFVAEALGRLPLLTGNPLPQDALQLQNGTWKYLHKQALDNYQSMIKAEKAGARNQELSDFTLRYLYLLAITGEEVPTENKEAQVYFIDRVAHTLPQQDLYEKALSAIILQKAGKTTDAANFIVSLKEYAVQTPDMGMYYDSKSAPYAPVSYRIPTQVAILEAMQLVARDMKMVDEMKIWLLRQKQTQSWDSPLATVNAIYALLDRGTDLLAGSGNVKITLGKQVIETNTSGQSSVPGLDYVKKTFSGNELKANVQSVSVQKSSPGIAWGAVYAQYLEEMGQITNQGGVLSVDKKLYVERMVDNRTLLVAVKEAGNLVVGDKVISRITVRAERDMDFIQLKDERAACLEPLSSLSGYQIINNAGCYVAVKDASTEFFFDKLKKGSYILEYSYYVTRVGNYSGGIAVLQSAYAPEFVAHTASEQVKVAK